ncbi:MAG TPA: hypothetical protein PKK43_07615 [Spirochaetota bacterium]|nr:hypothetical protein [Spirochaetota bacterium]
MDGMNTGIIEIDQAGNFTGEKKFGGYNLDEGADIVRGPGDTILITGSTTSYSDSRDIFVSAFDTKCDLIGYHVLKYDGLDTAVSLTNTEKDDEFMILGRSEMAGMKSVITMIRIRIGSLDMSGSTDKADVVFRQKLVSEEAEFSSDMIKTSMNEYCITGWAEAMSGKKVTPLLIRTNRYGELVDKRKLPCGSDAVYSRIDSLPGGGFSISGFMMKTSGNKDRDAFVSFINNLGESKIVTDEISTDRDDIAIASFEIDDNTVMIVGNRYSDGEKAFFVRTLKQPER